MANLSRRTDHSLHHFNGHEPVPAVSHVGAEVGHDNLGLQCDRLKVELAQMSDRLACLENEMPPRSTATRGAPAAESAEAVRVMIAARRRRSRFFSADMFADPAWDILLDLYIAELEQRRTMVSSLCLAAEVPATTALRWITSLVEREMLVRRPDPLDRRRVYIELSTKASDGMRRYFDGSESPAQQPMI